MRLKPFIATLASLLFLGHAAVAKVADDRVTLPREKGTPMGAVGMVLHLGANGSALGTGFLVSPCHVLTAAHVVSEPEGISADQVLLFFIGSGNLGPEYYEANSFAELSPARPVVWGESRDLHKGSTADRREAWQKAGWDDWALLKLDKCLGDEGYGYLNLLPMATTDFTREGNTRPITTTKSSPSIRPARSSARSTAPAGSMTAPACPGIPAARSSPPSRMQAKNGRGSWVSP